MEAFTGVMDSYIDMHTMTNLSRDNHQKTELGEENILIV